MTGSGLSLRQERALAISPKVMSSFSIPCSIFIIYEVFCDHRTRGTTAVQRALVGMSAVDILASSAWFMSTWAVPEGSFAYAAGNRTTCNYQGFLLQLAIGAPMYNSSLALFYLLMIKQRWSDERLYRIERWVHGFILSFTVGTSILLLQLEQYNHIGAVCWVIGEPAGCGNSSYQPSDVPCERGDYAWAWGLALFYGPLWVCVIACVTSMVILTLEVRKTHRRSLRYSSALGMGHSLRRSGSDSNKVAFQAMLYSFSFLVTWMPSTLWSIAHWFGWSHYGLDIAAATAEPLQGFWNLMIFLKNRPNTLLKVRRVLSSILPCVFSPPDDFDMGVSFGTGLRINRPSASNRFSSSLHMEGGTEVSKKQAHRNTLSTEAIEDIKSAADSIQKLENAVTGEGGRNHHSGYSERSDDLGAVCDESSPEVAVRSDASGGSCDNKQSACSPEEAESEKIDRTMEDEMRSRDVDEGEAEDLPIPPQLETGPLGHDACGEGDVVEEYSTPRDFDT